ncbi:unnamed protein product, partial [Cuscuta campestris]
MRRAYAFVDFRYDSLSFPVGQASQEWPTKCPFIQLSIKNLESGALSFTFLARSSCSGKLPSIKYTIRSYIQWSSAPT